MTRRAPIDSLDLATLEGVAQACTLCALSGTRKRAVFGRGRPDADVMFVVDAPGYHDDETGTLLTGEAGQVLADLLLSEAGMHLDETYVAPVVKCRPPRNRGPWREEVEQCEGYLFRQVALVRPVVVCPLGNLPTRLLTGRSDDLASLHGTPRPTQMHGRTVTLLPLYHPGAARFVPELLGELRLALRQLPSLLKSASASTVSAEASQGEQVAARPAAPEQTEPEQTEPEQQLSLLGP